ncbi:MAG: 16S rRNA (guanine(966)-N(2))-methyltransferase RsmD [Oscillospiraceae bacterium]|nr:16S rRNA (guanine(966)-N(2))-methyltransferase RsmD [Oscillospiraceae bacterium]
MRIISGTKRGRKLKEPADYSVRPTTDMVKEAVFNIIQFDIEGRKVLDLFAGSGQLGIEALSRGAASAVFVDKAPDSLKLVRENIKLAGFEKESRIVAADSIAFLSGGEKFDLIFLDPPYDTDLLEKSIISVNKFDILKENGIMVCESQKEKVLPEVTEPYFRLKEYRYGKIRITTFSRRAAEKG